MIETNLGNFERAVRLLVGLVMGGWALARPELDAIAWLAAVSSVCLLLNAAYGRCYLWHLLDISSCGCNKLPPTRLCDGELTAP
jgi:hypothetical protein